MDDDYRRSADNELEPDDDIYLPQQHQSRLSNDDDSPAAPADDVHPRSPIDDPSTDDQLDSDELYQEGVSGATNADDEEVSPDGEPKPLDDTDES